MPEPVKTVDNRSVLQKTLDLVILKKVGEHVHTIQEQNRFPRDVTCVVSSAPLRRTVETCPPENGQTTGSSTYINWASWDLHVSGTGHHPLVPKKD